MVAVALQISAGCLTLALGLPELGTAALLPLPVAGDLEEVVAGKVGKSAVERQVAVDSSHTAAKESLHKAPSVSVDPTFAPPPAAAPSELELKSVGAPRSAALETSVRKHVGKAAQTSDRQRLSLVFHSGGHAEAAGTGDESAQQTLATMEKTSEAVWADEEQRKAQELLAKTKTPIAFDKTKFLVLAIAVCVTSLVALCLCVAVPSSKLGTRLSRESPHLPF